jgi:hypothetical protein
MSTVPPVEKEPKRIDLDSPRWDQSTFSGRFKHFAGITNMLLSLKSDKELNEAHDLLRLYRLNFRPPIGANLMYVPEVNADCCYLIL